MLFLTLDNLLLFFVFFVCILVCRDEFNDTKTQMNELRKLMKSSTNKDALTEFDEKYS